MEDNSMAEQFENFLILAKDAYKAGNKVECINFCNQALSINPTDIDAKAFKGCAVLLSFSLQSANSVASEALGIWETLSDSPSEEMVNFVCDEAISFENTYRNATYSWMAEHKSNAITEAFFEPEEALGNCKNFMERFMNIGFIKDSVHFANFVKNSLVSLEGMDIYTVYHYVEINKDRNDEVGAIVKEISSLLVELEKQAEEQIKKDRAKTIKIVIGIAAGIAAMGLIVNVLGL